MNNISARVAAAQAELEAAQAELAAFNAKPKFNIGDWVRWYNDSAHEWRYGRITHIESIWFKGEIFGKPGQTFGKEAESLHLIPAPPTPEWLAKYGSYKIIRCEQTKPDRKTYVVSQQGFGVVIPGNGSIGVDPTPYNNWRWVVEPVETWKPFSKNTDAALHLEKCLHRKDNPSGRSYFWAICWGNKIAVWDTGEVPKTYGLQEAFNTFTIDNHPFGVRAQ